MHGWRQLGSASPCHPVDLAGCPAAVPFSLTPASAATTPCATSAGHAGTRRTGRTKAAGRRRRQLLQGAHTNDPAAQSADATKPNDSLLAEMGNLEQIKATGKQTGAGAHCWCKPNKLSLPASTARLYGQSASTTYHIAPLHPPDPIPTFSRPSQRLGSLPASSTLVRQSACLGRAGLPSATAAHHRPAVPRANAMQFALRCCADPAAPGQRLVST